MAGLIARLIGGDLATLANDPLGEICRWCGRGTVVPLNIALQRGQYSTHWTPSCGS